MVLPLKSEARLIWRRMSRQWMGKFPWLHAGRHKNGRWAAGCKWCKHAKLETAFGRYQLCTRSSLHVAKFRKHEGTDSHKKAASAYLEHSTCDDLFSPPDDQWHSLASKIEAGDATLSRTKERWMTWCLSEAMKVIDQKHLEKSNGICLFRDESKNRLAIRFRTVSSDLVEHSGTLGHERHPGTGAAKITMASSNIIARACTRFLARPKGMKPRNPSKVEPFVLRPLLKHTLHSVKAITVDAAADEVLSAEMMRSSELNPMAMTLTPNL
eukprot:1351805-Karenia_brevis.AAC.1